MRVAHWHLVVIFLACICGLSPAFAADSDIVQIPDPALASVLHRQAKVPEAEPLTRGDLARVTSMFVRFDETGDLEGIQYCVNLESLNIDLPTAPPDLTPLAQLQRLRWLELGSHQWNVDVGVLEHLPLLEYLDLDTGTSDLTPLRGLTRLKELHLGHSALPKDLMPLAGLTALETLSLPEEEVTDITALAGLTKLTSLTLPLWELQDIGPLSHLINLEYLYLVAAATDWEPMASLVNLKTLHVGGLTTTTPLRTMSQLTELSIQAPRYEDLELDTSGLKGCVSLKTLAMADGGVVDLGPLAGCTQLEELALNSNRIADLSPLGGLKHLWRLDLAENLDDTGQPPYEPTVVDIGPLAQCTALRELDLTWSGVADVSPLAHCPQLWKLTMANTSIQDFTPLGEVATLRVLDLSGTKLTNLAPLAPLNQVRVLDLSYNSIGDLRPLFKLQGLRDVTLISNPLTRQARTVQIPQLEERGVGVSLTSSLY